MSDRVPRAAGDPARVAVVIVTYESRAHIERCLRAVEAQTLQPARTIVVDNASADGSAELVAERFPDVELVRMETNTGFAAANNLAVARADDCDWVALLNPDAFPDPGWLAALLGAASANPDYGFFASRMLRADDPTRLDGTGDVYHVAGIAWRRDRDRRGDGVRRPQGEVFSACAAAALYRRDAFVAAGGFEESFFCYCEDTDLAFRLRLRGERCLYVPDAIVEHVASASSGEESDFTAYHLHRNGVWVFVRNMPGLLFWRYLPRFLALNVLGVASLVRRGRRRPALRAKRDALRGLPRALRQRRAIQSARAVDPRELRRAMETRPWLGP